jgi:acyl-CoA synthetase (AMP-forming)/AMP-acid ligase II
MVSSTLTEVATLGDVMLGAALKYPQRDALVLPRQRITYGSLRRGAYRLARALIGMGVRRCEHIGLLIPNCCEFAEALFGITLIGAVAVPLNVRLKAPEIGYILRNAKLVTLLTSCHADDPVDFPALLSAAVNSGPTTCLRDIVLVRGADERCSINADALSGLTDTVNDDSVELRRRRVRVRDPALILYTSGTTASPKGCVLSHEAVTRGPVERARYRLKVDGKDVVWGGGPLFHIGTLAPFIGSLGVAGTFLTDTHFDAGRALELMYAEKVTLMWPWFSAIVQGLIGHPTFDATKLECLRYLFLIAPPTLVDTVQTLFPKTEVIQACGMTETAGIFALCDADESQRSRSTTHGKASPGVEVRIVDPETGVDLPDGTLGEIWVRGYNVMEGYWAAPEKTTESLSPDGWLKTGDLYTRLPGGSLVFGGRCKDMLKVGGENVAAVEVEAVLCNHPSVKAAEVVGRPDIRLDEVPVAFVELYTGNSIDAASLIEHCRERLASYKVPRFVYFMETSAWPMSATKIDKRSLRELARENAKQTG